MQEQLIIFLHTYDSTRPSWVVMEADSSIKQCIRHGNPDELTFAAAEKEIIVLVPAEDVLLTVAKLPKMSRARFSQALPYALEEQLTSDIDKLHFAHGETQADGELPVAVASIDKMQEWITLLQSWQIQADVLSPVSLALPFDSTTWHVVNNEMAIVRTGLYQGFACDKINLNPLLNMALTSATLIPEGVHVHHYTHETSAEPLLIQTKSTEDFNPPDAYLTDLARHVSQSPTINLLQGPYRVKKAKFPRRVKIWRATAYLAIAWVLLLFFYPTVSYFILRARVNNMETQIAQIYKRHFPQSSNIVAPKLRMEEKLQKLNTQIGENKFLLSIGLIGKGMLDTPSIKLKHLEFQNNELILELTAGSSDDIAKFTDYLTQRGLNVKQQNANLTGARISATLVII